MDLSLHQLLGRFTRQPFSGNSLRLPTLCTTGRFQCMCKCKDLVCFSLQDIWKLHVMRLFLIIVICHRLLKYTQFLHPRTLDNLFKVLSACTGSGLEWVNKWTNSTVLVGLFYLARQSSALIYSFVQNSNNPGHLEMGQNPVGIKSHGQSFHQYLSSIRWNSNF